MGTAAEPEAAVEGVGVEVVRNGLYRESLIRSRAPGLQAKARRFCSTDMHHLPLHTDILLDTSTINAEEKISEHKTKGL